MATSPQKSPSTPKSPTPKSPPSRKKDDSFLGKLGGTLARRKKAKEVSDLQEEGINAINLPLNPIPYELDPEDTMLEENEVRTMIDPYSRSDPRLQELMKVLIDWINDVLVGERIIVKDLAEDLYDGQVLQKLFEKLEGEKLNVAEVTQSEIAQKQKLQTVLEKINETLKLPPRSIKWNVDSVHAKSVVAILHLLVALSQYFRAPIRLPDHVSIQVVVVQMLWRTLPNCKFFTSKAQKQLISMKLDGMLQSRQIQEEITGDTEALSGRHERDAFDTLFDHAPDKLNVVKKTLITFVNKHLNKLNLEVTELETQFADGVYLVLLMGLLEGYFVPLYNFFLTPDSFEQKVVNVSFAFELMQDGGLEKPKPRPEDIVNCDLKSTLRVLYNLFTKYRSVE
ncbi:alpha-parvin isoform X1 [Phyllobates terribilis]|uniref:alpha-parvin isoform X1 n=1 Tax=Phyllobates terribilis TaxID=111132 RepID=UPI003CCB51FD